MGKRILSELMNTQLQNTRESYNAKQSKEWGLPSGASPGGEERTWQQKVNKLRLIKPTATRAHSQNHAILRDSPGKPQLGEAGTQGQHHLSEEPGQYNTKRTQSHILDHEVTLPLKQVSAPASTHAALGPVDVEEGKGEQGFVPLFGQQLLLELNKVGFQVNHLWSSAIGPKTVFKSHWENNWTTQTGK